MSGEVKLFEAGKWYRYTGNRAYSGWVDVMEFVLDGKPRACIYGNGYSARFGRRRRPDSESMWYWAGGIEHWRVLEPHVVVKGGEVSPVEVDKDGRYHYRGGDMEGVRLKGLLLAGWTLVLLDQLDGTLYDITVLDIVI